MNIGVLDIFWTFLLLSSLTPMLRQRLLQTQRRPSVQYIPVPYRREKDAEQRKSEQSIAF